MFNLCCKQFKEIKQTSHYWRISLNLTVHVLLKKSLLFPYKILSFKAHIYKCILINLGFFFIILQIYSPMLSICCFYCGPKSYRLIIKSTYKVSQTGFSTQLMNLDEYERSQHDKNFLSFFLLNWTCVFIVVMSTVLQHTLCVLFKVLFEWLTSKQSTH